MTKPLNIGMIGYGFMGRTHSNAYNRVSNFFDNEYKPVLKAACARDAAKLKDFADRWGYESIETDWRKMIARKDIDAVDICVPNNLHKEMAIACAEAGKMILCEKPLAMNVAEGEEMCAAVEKAGVVNTVWYNYRRVPAVSLAKQLIDEGKLGRIFHYRANFLQDWTIAEDLPQGGAALWRLDAAAAGSGVTGDLLAHCIDTAIWLNGNVTNVTAMTETFVKQRKHNLTGKVEPVASMMPVHSCATSVTVRLACSSRRVTRAVIRHFTLSRSTASMRRSSGICTICIGLNISITEMKAACEPGVRFTSPMAIIRT